VSDDNERSGEPSGDNRNDSGLELARLVSRSLARGKKFRPKQNSRTGFRRQRSFTKSTGAHPDDRDPQRLDNTVGRLVNDLGWETDLRVHGVFGRWTKIVGEAVAEHCTPESFNAGRLLVRTDSTAWATQLTFLAAQVIGRLNEELGEGTVTFLDIKGPSQKSWKKGRLSVPGRGPRDTYG
jgi:predicted nucleic acid-binding Zn ribbon protein